MVANPSIRRLKPLLDAIAVSVLVTAALGRPDGAAQPDTPALAPVSGDEMKAVLDRDLELVLSDGELAAQTSSGVAIGVLRDGVRSVFAYGAARPDSIFEIGSVTKTFTGLILAQMIEQRVVQHDTPVRELLPTGTDAEPGNREITLLDLITHHSGLPRQPHNSDPADPNNPHADHRPGDLYAFMAQQGVEAPANAGFLYSNLGVGLLGQALANRAGTSYEKLLEEQITAPLGLQDTVISLTPQQRTRFIQGYTADHREARAWDVDALAGTGAIRSTAGDLLTYLDANLHPERAVSGAAGSRSTARTLSRALSLSHEIHREARPGEHIAFAWIVDAVSGIYWHNGATGGYSSFVFFNPAEDYAAVVLINVASGGPHGNLAERLGLHVAQRLAGVPVASPLSTL